MTQNLNITRCCFAEEKELYKRARWKTQGRGTGYGVPGYGVRGLVENAGSGGKRGIWWKTRGLVENAGNHFFRQNMNFSQ